MDIKVDEACSDRGHSQAGQGRGQQDAPGWEGQGQPSTPTPPSLRAARAPGVPAAVTR